MSHFRLFSIHLLILISSVVFADGNGGFSGAFLRIGLGARGMAMGNAQVATADYGYGAYYNPAALPLLKKRQVSFSYSNMSLDRRFNYVGFSLPLPPYAGASVGWVYSGVGDLRAYNSNGQDVGEIDHGLHALSASFAVKIIALAQADKQLANLPPDLISLGVTIKYLYEGIDDNAEFKYHGSGLGFDIGLLVKPHSKMMVGYQIKDINSRLASNTNDIFERGSDLPNRFPVIQKAGLFYRTPLDWAAIAYDFEWSNKGENKHHLGTELSYQVARARLGYDNDHLTIGGGLKFHTYKRFSMTLDYAFVDDVEDEGVSHVFSWQFLF